MNIANERSSEVYSFSGKDTQNGLRKTIISGVGWNTVAQIGVELLNFASIIVLMRLLSPEAFGIIGMITIIVGFARLFSDFGLGAAIIQRKIINTEHLNSVFWLNLAIGVCLTLLFIAIAPFVAQFYSQTILTPITIALSINFLIGSIQTVHSSLLLRTVDFRNIAIVELLSIALGGGVGIVMALLGYGLWSLVGQSVSASICKTILMWTVCNWRPHRQFKWRAIQDLWHFSIHLLGMQSTLYWVRNADNLLIGRVLGSIELGVYTRAYSLMLLPIRTVSSTLGRVLFPAFSSIQDDKERVARGFLSVTRSAAFFTFPLMAGLLVVSDNFVLTLFGKDWIAIIPLLRVFCMIGMVESISTFNGTIYQSQGRTDLQFRVALVLSFLSIAAFIVGLRWGALGVATAYAAYSLIITYPTMYIALSLIGLNFLSVMKHLVGTFFCAAVMALTVWEFSLFLLPSWATWLQLTVQVSVGVAVYVILVHLLRVPAYLEVRKLVWEQIQLRPRFSENHLS